MWLSSINNNRTWLLMPTRILYLRGNSGPVGPCSSWYYIETVEHWFSQCCDSCSCLADICFHPLPCSDVFAWRAVEVLVLSNECCLKNIYWCMLLQINEGTHQVKKFTASLSSFCPWLNIFTIMSLICCICHAIFFPKGFIWTSLCTATEWYIYEKCKPLQSMM